MTFLIPERRYDRIRIRFHRAPDQFHRDLGILQSRNPDIIDR
jgi:hypothetical protein